MDLKFKESDYIPGQNLGNQTWPWSLAFGVVTPQTPKTYIISFFNVVM